MNPLYLGYLCENSELGVEPRPEADRGMARHESGSIRSEAQQLLDYGFVVLREVIPARLLETVRASGEKLVDQPALDLG